MRHVNLRSRRPAGERERAWLPAAGNRVRLFRLLFPAALSIVPALGAQQPAQPPAADTAARPGIGVRLRFPNDSLVLERPAALGPFGRLAPSRDSGATLADRQVAGLLQMTEVARAARWGEAVVAVFADSARAPVAQLPDSAFRIPQSDSSRREGLFGDYADLGLHLTSRIETKIERDRNERCRSSDLLTPFASCAGTIQPQMDFQFNVQTGGVVADRIHVNVDYDSEREFDASNNISIYYQGKPDEMLHRLEVGNVSFAAPASRFITAGIPSGNYGLQAVGQIGPMQFRSIVAQQKGNVVRDKVFTVGDRSVQTIERDIEDFVVERGRFFWVIDPRRAFAGRFPNVDILGRDLEALAAAIPPGERPRRVLLYRYRPPTPGGSVSRDINGPYAVTRYARNTNEIGPFDVLQEGIDYYIDPTNLWIALVNPVQRGERLAVSYTVSGPAGDEVILGPVGGTFPTSRGPAGRDTINLLWDAEVLPGDAVFDQEIRSVYRLGGEDLRRETVQLKIVVGAGGDQERPIGAPYETFLQMFGLAQPVNPSAFDVENRLWPRPSDPNLARNAAQGGAKLIRDYFVVFPSLRPFADSGMADPPNPLNDSLYRTPYEDLFTQRRPPTQYRLRARYASEGGGDAGTLALGGVQIRQGSERLNIDGVPLVRDVDYRVDYELGRVSFTRPDTLFARPRRVTVQYEENPIFAAQPTSILGLAAEFPTEAGRLSFTAMSQRQKTTFNRPLLGFEPASSLVAGVTGQFSFTSDALTRVLDRLPFVDATQQSRIDVQGEFATSRPQPNAAGVAYVETFEGEGGIGIVLGEQAWRLGSRPYAPGGVPIGGTPYHFELDSAAAIAWQNLVRIGDLALQFFPEQVDTAFKFVGGQAFRVPEIILWNTLYPTGIEGFLTPRGQATPDYLWETTPRPGRRWRSLMQPLAQSGIDLTRVEQIEFWTMIETDPAKRERNPTIVLDLGDISENAVAFRPETLFVTGADSAFRGRALTGYDVMDSERDEITRSFDAATDDVGLPSDRADTLIRVVDGATERLLDAELCLGGSVIAELGDTRHNCSIRNRRLDEEDLDLDGVLNMSGPENSNERLMRYVIDLADPESVTKVGLCHHHPSDRARTGPRTFCWALVRVPLASAELINDPLVRRIRAARLTIVSGDAADTSFTYTPVSRFRLLGAPWVKRATTPLTGIAGTRETGLGSIQATVIGTLDAGTTGIRYQPPPGVAESPDDRTADVATERTQVNEKSLRLLTTALDVNQRAEAYYRFPEGDKSFMGYRSLRVWARGRGKGWGANGDLQFYVRVGRDADNFYLYRSPANVGPDSTAWLPEHVIEFSRFYRLRTQLQNAFLRGGDSLACSGVDLALIEASQPPTAPGSRRFAACQDGYIVYTANPAITPPNLAAVQELSVGIVRVSAAGGGVGGPISPLDTLELWVDDVRLGEVVDDAGYAGQFGVTVAASDLGSMTVNVSRRDHNFRQLGEAPSYVTDDQLNLTSSVRLDRLLPRALGLAIPVTINHASSGTDPFFLARSDISGPDLDGLRKPKTSATSYTVALRRATRRGGGVTDLLLDNLSVQSAYTTGAQRSEYQTGDASSFTGSVDWDFSRGDGEGRRMPGWVRGAVNALPGWLRESAALRGLRDASLRFSPAAIRLTSGWARAEDRRASFALPVFVAEDTGRTVASSRHDWRNRALVELRPVDALMARIDVNSVRDLRNYGDDTDVALVAGFERAELFGLDVGLERERQMQSALRFTPAVAAWLRPSFEVASTFTMFRDPNTSRLLRADGDTGELRLPRRLSNSQVLSAAAAVDLGGAIGRYAGDSGIARRIANAIQPVRLSWTREMRSLFDETPFTPGFSYQFAFGGIEDFRSLGDVLATSAGVARGLTVDHTLSLPFGASFTQHYQRTVNNTWTRRAQDAQSMLEARSVTFPDVALRWTFRPGFLSVIVSSVSAEARASITRASSFQPALPGGAITLSGVRTELETRQYPLRGTLSWTLFGGFTTSAGWLHTTRRELRAGGTSEGEQNDVTADISKLFALPQSWGLPSSMLRAYVGMQRISTETVFLADTTERRIADNGRWALNARAETDVAENASFSLSASRTVTYDEVNDRRFTQFVLSAVLQLQFFAGELK
ncbi:MAG TPA: cell surface protein SprA [Gemmatimonadaceae bacterium]|nr:cell surface protein SprA [Gemmatimonadaceae bacterium]